MNKKAVKYLERVIYSTKDWLYICNDARFIAIRNSTNLPEGPLEAATLQPLKDDNAQYDVTYNRRKSFIGQWLNMNSEETVSIVPADWLSAVKILESIMCAVRLSNKKVVPVLITAQGDKVNAQLHLHEETHNFDTIRGALPYKGSWKGWAVVDVKLLAETIRLAKALTGEDESLIMSFIRYERDIGQARRIKNFEEGTPSPFLKFTSTDLKIIIAGFRMPLKPYKDLNIFETTED
ncbi:hypothetical protein [Pectinatus frisingensis]|uniref:hypothetical protein n=1 Tax=Pectinatus frisingensis TaxID=865 RepID=UPI0018C7610E|nr:hypothetical protein [Pectinatus frisingensis]